MTGKDLLEVVGTLDWNTFVPALIDQIWFEISGGHVEFTGIGKLLCKTIPNIAAIVMGLYWFIPNLILLVRMGLDPNKSLSADELKKTWFWMLVGIGIITPFGGQLIGAILGVIFAAGMGKN